MISKYLMLELQALLFSINDFLANIELFTHRAGYIHNLINLYSV